MWKFLQATNLKDFKLNAMSWIAFVMVTGFVVMAFSIITFSFARLPRGTVTIEFVDRQLNGLTISLTGFVSMILGYFFGRNQNSKDEINGK